MNKNFDEYFKIIKEFPLLSYLDTSKIKVEENKSNIDVIDSLIIKGNFDMLLFNGYFFSNKY